MLKYFSTLTSLFSDTVTQLTKIETGCLPTLRCLVSVCSDTFKIEPLAMLYRHQFCELLHHICIALIICYCEVYESFTPAISVASRTNK